MAFRSGLGAQLGLSKESTYGTYQAPARFFPFTSEGLSLSKEYVRSQGLRAGQLSQLAQLHRGTTRSVEGQTQFELMNTGMGIFFDLLTGATVTGEQIGSSDAYGFTFPVGLSPSEKSATVQVGRPSTDGTIQPFSYVGCMISQMSISLEQSGLATCTVTFDGRDELTSEALAVATYDSDQVPFDFTQGVVEFGGDSAGNVRSATIEIQIPLASNRYHFGNSGVKDQPIPNGLVAITCNTTLEFASLADHNRFKSEQIVELSLPLVGDEIENGGGNKYSCTFTLPAAKQVSSGPTVQGPDVITTDVSFEALANGTDAPLSIEYVTTDTTI